jgi:signal transduction histidine kinase
MPVWAKTRLLEPTGLFNRLLLIGLAALVVALSARQPSQALIALGAGYAGWTLLRFALPPLAQPAWLGALTAIVDAGATTAFVGLAASSSLPPWILYVFPLAAASAAGMAPALIAGAMALAGYGALWAGGLIAGQAALWPLAALAAFAVSAALLPSRWLGEWRKGRFAEALADQQTLARRERVLREAVTRMLATFDADLVGHAAENATRSLQMGTRPLQGDESEWLKRLGEAAELALLRCSQHLDLKAEEQRLRSMWETLPAPAALSSPSGELLLANTAYRDLELPADVPDELTAGEPPRTFVAMRVQLPNSGCRLTLLRDVTQERQELVAKDEFLSLVGHELRTPLTSIHGFSQMIDRNLSIIKQQVGQLDRLINDLAAESSGKGGSLSLDLELVDVSELAAAAAERFRASYPDRKLEPRLSPTTAVKADPSRLNQVIDNLLNNAVKYSPRDAPIELGAELRHDQVVLSVRDRGVGIEREHLPHVFERFFRVPNAETEQVKGLGLGLSIVRDLVAAHGGRVWAESDGPGRGCTFLISLPVQPQEEAGAEADPGRVSIALEPDGSLHALNLMAGAPEESAGR